MASSGCMRSMFRGVGFETADFSKPLVGIASTWSKATL